MNLLNPSTFRTVVHILLLSFLIAMLGGCRARQSAATKFEPGDTEYVLLDLIGYNYTDREIDNYSINGHDAGDIRLSSPTSGGGGIVCCVKLSKTKTKRIIVTVRWQVDGCTYLTRSATSGRIHEDTREFYKETDVDVQGAGVENPRHLEAHFYPDGSVQVLLTEDMSIPRLSLDEGRADKSKFPRCDHDKEFG